MVRIAQIATGLGAIATVVSGLTIPDVDANGVQIAIGFDPTAAFFVAQGEVPTETVNYDPAVLLGMGQLIAEPSNHTDVELAQRAIIGTDDRANWEDGNYPYSAIGKVQWSNGAWCTGTLVGPRHVITARHCTPINGEAVSVRFSPFFYNGETRYPGSQVTAYIFSTNQDGDCQYGLDWAIHILQDRIGEQRGYFGARNMGAEWLNRNIYYNFGYPGDRNGGQRPIRSSGGRLTRTGGCGSDSPTLGNIDTAGGQSGGPIWEYPGSGDRYVQGTLYGSSATESYWATGQTLVNAVISARRDFP
ncbi:glutamyl endopeptidase [Microdochium nivale]|nr:glutamyl endopeptidase [Microdochium nivale]